MTFYIRLAFTSGLALRRKGAAYFTKSQLSETDNISDETAVQDEFANPGVPECHFTKEELAKIPIR
jgi:hypothetical protein